MDEFYGLELMQTFIKSYIDKSMNFSTYMQLALRLTAEGKSTSEPTNEAYINYTKLNTKRMERLNKTLVLNEATQAFFEQLQGDYVWLVITEPWCGDAAQIVPALNKMSLHASSIDMRLVLRDENPELMDQFEQKGSRAIPVLVLVDKSENEVLGSWGARPKPAQEMVEVYKKANPRPPYEELQVDLQKWYNKDKTNTLQKELIDFMELHQQKLSIT